MKKIIEWIKSLFKKEEVKLGKCPEFMTKEKQVELANVGLKVCEVDKKDVPNPSFTATEEIKSKKRKRGRPRKKKVEQK